MKAYERFLKYVSFPTMSDEKSETCPSTAKQKLLGAAIVEEMNTRLAEIFTVARSKGNDHAQDVQQASEIINETAKKLN